MSSDFVVFRAGVALVLMCSFYKSTEDPLPELSPQQYFSTLQPGKASLAYFCQVGSLSNSLFLEELKEAIRPLQDYGISVSKVNCVKEEASRYCGKEEALMKAYLFRGNILLREFPTDTLFDVNAIVAHVLLPSLITICSRQGRRAIYRDVSPLTVSHSCKNCSPWQDSYAFWT
ncbi:Thioredoxin domain-containing protein 16 [Cricetulus griseus]|nr:Thioredoxin domain-containing protein 16 [Cricetulus griseus]